MPGSVSIDLGLDDDALSCEWTLGGLPDVELWAQYASPGADSVPLRFTGSYQRDDTGAISAVEVVMRGRHKEYDGGETNRAKAARPKSRPNARTTSSRLTARRLSRLTSSTWC